MASVRSIFLMLFAPPLVLLAWAHAMTLLPSEATDWMPLWLGSALGWLFLIAVAAIGLAGILTAPWPDKVRAIVAAVYAPLFLISLPFQALIAGCTTGNCI